MPTYRQAGFNPPRGLGGLNAALDVLGISGGMATPLEQIDPRVLGARRPAKQPGSRSRSWRSGPEWLAQRIASFSAELATERSSSRRIGTMGSSLPLITFAADHSALLYPPSTSALGRPSSIVSVSSSPSTLLSGTFSHSRAPRKPSGRFRPRGYFRVRVIRSRRPSDATPSALWRLHVQMDA